MRAERKHCLNTTNIIIKGFPSIKKLFTTTKSRKSMNLSIIVKGIVQLPKTTNLKRNIVLALQRNKKLRRKKRLLLIRDRGLFHHFSNVSGFLRHILRYSLKGTIRLKFLLDVVWPNKRGPSQDDALPSTSQGDRSPPRSTCTSRQNTR